MEWEFRTAVSIDGKVVNVDGKEQAPEEQEIYLGRHRQGGWQLELMFTTGTSDGESVIVLKRPKE